MKKSTMHVGLDNLGDYFVSTVQLTIEHPWNNETGGYWYETMIFPVVDGKTNFCEIYCDRYKTEQEAVRGHQKALDYLAKLES